MLAEASHRNSAMGTAVPNEKREPPPHFTHPTRLAPVASPPSRLQTLSGSIRLGMATPLPDGRAIAVRRTVA